MARTLTTRPFIGKPGFDERQKGGWEGTAHDGDMLLRVPDHRLPFERGHAIACPRLGLDRAKPEWS